MAQCITNDLLESAKLYNVSIYKIVIKVFDLLIVQLKVAKT